MLKPVTIQKDQQERRKQISELVWMNWESEQGGNQSWQSETQKIKTLRKEEQE